MKSRLSMPHSQLFCYDAHMPYGCRDLEIIGDGEGETSVGSRRVSVVASVARLCMLAGPEMSQTWSMKQRTCRSLTPQERAAV